MRATYRKRNTRGALYYFIKMKSRDSSLQKSPSDTFLCRFKREKALAIVAKIARDAMSRVSLIHFGHYRGKLQPSLSPRRAYRKKN